jgi:hypothetical protein
MYIKKTLLWIAKKSTCRYNFKKIIILILKIEISMVFEKKKLSNLFLTI